MLDGGAVRQWNRAWLVVVGIRHVSFGIGVHERQERPALRTTLAHIDFVVTQQNFGIDDPPAIATNAARQLMENIV